MTTETLDRPTQSTSTRSLEDQLAPLTFEQYEAIFAHYGQEGLNKYDELSSTNATPEQWQSAMAEFLNNDNNQQQKDRLLKQLEEYNATYRLREESLKVAEDVASEALKTRRKSRNELNKTIKEFTKTLEDNISDTNKELLQQRRIEQANYSAWEKRERQRVRGIEDYVKGLVAAVIDDVEQEYKNTTRSKSEKMSKAAKAAVQAYKDKGEDPETQENTDKRAYL